MNLAETNFNQFRNDVLNALAAVAEKYGCEVSAGNIKYDNLSIDLTLYFKSKGENGESAEEMDFKANCEKYGFSPEDYQKEFSLNGKTYYLVGFNPRARKNHCIIKDEKGSQFVCSIPTIKSSI